MPITFSKINKKLAISLTVAVYCLFLNNMDVRASDATLFASNWQYNLPIESYKERRFRTVIRQQYDFSCGSAALSTLLNFHYDRNHSEEEILKAMYDIGDKQKILKEGFSLLDMKNYIESLGMKANGYRAPLDKLRQVGIPAIALISSNGYLHFVVIKGVSDRTVLVGDPASGLKVVDRSSFEKMWNKIIFVVLSDKDKGQENFNQYAEWHLNGTASFDAALSDKSLAGLTVQISPTPNYFF